MAAGARVAVVAGATGLVGREILARLLADNTWITVHCVGRSAPAVVHPKLVVHLAPDLSAFVAPPADDVFIALGTTIKVAGSALTTDARASLGAGTTSTIDTGSFGATVDGFSGTGNLRKTGGSNLAIATNSTLGNLSIDEGSVSSSATVTV